MDYLQFQEHNLSLITGAFSGLQVYHCFKLISYSIGNFGYVPVEVLKSRAQYSKDSNYTYRSQIPQIIKNEGYKGLFKGFWATFFRDVPGWGVYFYAYEGLKALCTNYMKPDSRRKHDLAIRLTSGGIAGQLSWIVSFPFDVIKT